MYTPTGSNIKYGKATANVSPIELTLLSDNHSDGVNVVA